MQSLLPLVPEFSSMKSPEQEMIHGIGPCKEGLVVLATLVHRCLFKRTDWLTVGGAVS